MEENQNLEIVKKRKELKELEEQLSLLQNTPFSGSNKQQEIDNKIRNLFSKIDLVRGEIRFLEGNPIVSNEKLDIYLDNGSIENGCGIFEIHLHGTPNRIGYVRLIRDPHNSFGNISYALDEKYRGHHFMLQSLDLLKDTMLKMKIVKPIITVEPDNEASIKTIQAFGGVLTENNGWYDTYEVDLTEKQSPKKR